MPKKIHVPAPAASALKKLGSDINSARRVRRIPTAVMAERAGITKITLRKVEQGNPQTSIAAYANVLFVLGFTDKLRNLADIADDYAGRMLGEKNLPQRIRFKNDE